MRVGMIGLAVALVAGRFTIKRHSEMIAGGAPPTIRGSGSDKRCGHKPSNGRAPELHFPHLSAPE